MKKFSIKKTVSFLCSAALLLTQAIAVLPASAEETGTPLVTKVLSDDFERDDLSFVKEKNCTAEIESKTGIDGSSALKITSNEKRSTATIAVKNSDKTTFDVSAGNTYKLIVKFSYKLDTSTSFMYSPAQINAVTIGSNGYILEDLGQKVLMGNVELPTHWDILSSQATGEWKTVSIAAEKTVTKDGQLALLFNSNSGTGSMLIDNLEVYAIDASTTGTTMVLNDGVSKYSDLAAWAAGDDISNIPAPSRDGYSFDGWYIDSALTEKCEVVPELETGEKYINLYAKWKGVPKTVLYDDFEREEDLDYKDVTSNDGEASIVSEVGINDSSALLVDITKTQTQIYLKPQNEDGSAYKINSGEELNLIVKFSYRMETESFVYNTLEFKPAIVDDNFGWKQNLTSLYIGQSAQAPTEPVYNTFGSVATGKWREVSIPIRKTATASGNFMIIFNATTQTGSILIDNLEVISLTSDLTSTTMSLNLNNGSKTTELVTMVAGDNISELPVPEKSGYTFAGWYTDSNFTEKCDVVPETTKQYITLYAGYDVSYCTVTEDYERYSEDTPITDNLTDKLADRPTFEVLQEENGNQYLHIKSDGQKKYANMYYILKNSNGSGLGQSFANGKTYSLIINLKYRMDDIQNEWGITLKPVIFWSDGKVISVPKTNPTVFGGYKDYYYGINDKKWHTMSVSFDYTAEVDSSDTGIGFLLDIQNRAFEISFDDISVQVLPSGTSASTVNLDGVVNGQTFVAGSVGSDIIVDDARLIDTLPKNIYKRTAKFTGYKIGDADFDGTFPEAGGKLTATFKNAVSAYDYNFDGNVNIIDLVRLKKNLANDSDYAKSVPEDGSALLAELRKVLLSVDTAKTINGVSYTLAYSDEFNGTAIDSSVWNIGESTGSVTYVNGGYYKTVLDKKYVSVSNGTAKISFAQADETVSIYKDASGNYYSNPTDEEIKAKSLESVEKSTTLKTVYGGAMRTNGNLEVKRGYIEAKVKFASETIDSAFWLNATATPTLRYNEIDIFETFGEDSATSNIHTWDNNNKSQGGTDFHYDWSKDLGDARKIATNIHDGKFHTIGLQWEEKYLKFYFDGECKFTVERTENNSNYFDAFANRLLYTEFSSSPKTGLSSWNGLEKSFEIDYIRYYQNTGSEFGMR